jgi:hypothetical protein
VVGIVRVDCVPVLNPKLGLCGVAELDVRRRAIEIERGGTRLVDIAAVDDHTAGYELGFTRVPG